jgi:uncharacterized membrane protein
VRNQSGLPVASALVTIGPVKVRTNADGVFSAANVEPGSYTIQVVANGYLSASQPVALDPGKDGRVDIVLRAANAPNPVLSPASR